MLFQQSPLAHQFVHVLLEDIGASAEQLRTIIPYLGGKRICENVTLYRPKQAIVRPLNGNLDKPDNRDVTTGPLARSFNSELVGKCGFGVF